MSSAVKNCAGFCTHNCIQQQQQQQLYLPTQHQNVHILHTTAATATSLSAYTALERLHILSAYKSSNSSICLHSIRTCIFYLHTTAATALSAYTELERLHVLSAYISTNSSICLHSIRTVAYSICIQQQQQQHLYLPTQHYNVHILHTPCSSTFIYLPSISKCIGIHQQQHLHPHKSVTDSSSPYTSVSTWSCICVHLNITCCIRIQQWQHLQLLTLQQHLHPHTSVKDPSSADTSVSTCICVHFSSTCIRIQQ